MAKLTEEEKKLKKDSKYCNKCNKKYNCKRVFLPKAVELVYCPDYAIQKS